jgi:hypothetical protein
MLRGLIVCLAAACLAGCSDTSGPGGLTFRNASALATRLESIDRAVSNEPLRALSSMANPMKNVGLDIHNMSPDTWGRTLEWSAVHAQLVFSNRAGAPPDGLRLILYTTDSTFQPIYPFHEVGHVDLYPHNTYNGGGPDSMSLRFVVTDTRTTPTVVADFLAHSHLDVTCVQCATVEGWANDGTTRVNFTVPYNIPLNSDGRFPGDFASTGFAFQHFATLPGPGVSTATANLALVFDGDSIAVTSGLLKAHHGRLDGSTTIEIDGASYATVARSDSGFTATGPNGRRLTSGELRAATDLFRVPADIAYYIEWPTFVIFFCGC